MKKLKGTIQVDRTAKLIKKYDPIDDIQHVKFDYYENPERYIDLISNVYDQVNHKNIDYIEYAKSTVLEYFDKRFKHEHIINLHAFKSVFNAKPFANIRLTNSFENKGYIDIYIHPIYDMEKATSFSHL